MELKKEVLKNEAVSLKDYEKELTKRTKIKAIKGEFKALYRLKLIIL